LELSSSPRGAATDERERVLERQTGARSSKPSFYDAWRDKSARLDRTVETLERISAALCVTPEGPGALCQALVDAASHHLSARWAAITFADGLRSHELPPVILRSADGVASGWDDTPPALRALAARAVAARGPVVARSDDGHTKGAAGSRAGRSRWRCRFCSATGSLPPRAYEHRRERAAARGGTPLRGPAGWRGKARGDGTARALTRLRAVGVLRVP
jgi:hypothetical protein